MFWVSFCGGVLHFSNLFVMFHCLDKEAKVVVALVFCAMDHMEVHDMQTLVDTLHKYFEYE